MIFKKRLNISIGDSNAVRKTEARAEQIREYASETASCLSELNSYDKGDFLELSTAMIHFHVDIYMHMDGDNADMQEAIGNIVLNKNP